VKGLKGESNSRQQNGKTVSGLLNAFFGGVAQRAVFFHESHEKGTESVAKAAKIFLINKCRPQIIA